MASGNGKHAAVAGRRLAELDCRMKRHEECHQVPILQGHVGSPIVFVSPEARRDFKDRPAARGVCGLRDKV
jgi:hypothetical protein